MHFLSVPKERQMSHDEDKEVEMERLMDRYGNDVLRTATLYLKNRQSAEDAFQEVFIKIYNKFDTFKNQSSEKTWILSITMNVCRDMLRSSWLKRVMLTDRLGWNNKGYSDLESKVIKKDERKTLLDEVYSLPPSFKEVIILYYYQGYDTKEISNVLKIAEGTVRSRLHRARDLLKQKIGGRIDWID